MIRNIDIDGGCGVPEKKVRVLIIDPYPVTGIGLAELIQRQSDMEMAGCCREAGWALERASEFRAELVVLEPETGEQGDIIGELVKTFSGAKVVAFSGAEDGGVMMEVLKAGASAYISKRASPEEIVCALRSVAAGEYYVDANMIRDLQPKRVEPEDAAKPSRGSGLTERETAVLQRLAQGFIPKEIAIEMGLSQKTVETYKIRGMRKLGLCSRPDVVRYGVRQGWLQALL